MFIPRHVYTTLSDRAVKAEAVESHLRHENARLEAHMTFLQIRVTELSMERAVMLKRYLNIDVPVPSFETAESPTDFNQTASFDALDAKEIARLGITWDDNGVLAYPK